MNCFVCAKKKEDYEVWTNKVVIGETHDSEFQNDEVIRSLPDKSVICHDCIKVIEQKIESKKRLIRQLFLKIYAINFEFRESFMT